MHDHADISSDSSQLTTWIWPSHLSHESSISLSADFEMRTPAAPLLYDCMKSLKCTFVTWVSIGPQDITI